MPIKACEQQWPAAQPVDEGDGNESRKHIGSADRPGGGLCLRFRRGEARLGEDIVGIIDDRIDAGDLLEHGEPRGNHEGLAPGGREDGAPGRHSGASARNPASIGIQRGAAV